MQIEYTSSRQEVWSFYWYQWRRKRLWLIQLSIALVVFLLALGFFASNIIVAALIGIISVAWMPLFPLIMFKVSRRTLQIDSNGISTTIGAISGKKSWNEIEIIEKVGDKICIFGKNGNGFIVPPRAFKNSDDADAFLKSAIEFHKATHP
jgi:hypothetical protein